MKGQLLTRLLSALLMCSCSFFAYAEGTLFTDKFDDYSLSGWRPSGNATASLANSPIRSGNYSAQLKLNRLEDRSSFRTELSLQSPKFEIGREYWIGFSNYLADPWPFAKKGEIIFQIHKRPDPTDQRSRQPLIKTTKGGVWFIQSTFDPNHDSTSSTVQAEQFRAGPIEKNRWNDWVIHVKWSYGSDGLLEIWKDGAKVVNKNGPNCSNDDLGPYIKIGVYNPFWRERSGATAEDKRTIHYDSVRVGDETASYDTVAP
jgi:hypothetical protein